MGIRSSWMTRCLVAHRGGVRPISENSAAAPARRGPSVFGGGAAASARRLAVLSLLAGARASLGAQETTPAAAAPFPVSIRVDVSRSLGALPPIWRFFGADEPNYATMKDGRRLIGELGALRPGHVYFRTHNLLNTGDGTPALKWGSTNAYTEDSTGRAVYDWTTLDRIFDGYLARGVRPYVEIGFMPKALSTKPEPYQHEWRPGLRYDLITTGWAYPPADYAKWGELVYRWVAHCVQRYGRQEVEQWYWEVWNEANIAAYWRGTPDEFYRLHDVAVAAVRRALPTARVGGPDVAGDGGAFMDGFLRHVTEGTNAVSGSRGTPTDFLSFHAKGSPSYVGGHVRMGIAAQLTTIDRGFGRIAAVPALRDRPIVIGESDPEGCAACQGAQLGYRNGTMYASYTAAAFARIHDLAARHRVVVDGALTWAFEFEDQPYIAGFRALASNGIDLPVLNVFRLFSRMGADRVSATSSGEIPLDSIVTAGVRGRPDVGVLASRDADRVTVLVWHYHDDDVPGPDADVTLSLAGLPAAAATSSVMQYRVDGAHANAYAAWRRMGAPIAPNDAQYRQLQDAARIEPIAPGAELRVAPDRGELRFRLPRQGVSLLVIDWSRARSRVSP
jgi:xylan 1,4-beta-xylosidase